MSLQPHVRQAGRGEASESAYEAILEASGNALDARFEQGQEVGAS